ncbi:unnamed protein product [Amoebophrya sp. A120]|nr:unnamed protein product [Amoebophrya sp. A120]|eukprot:GSA120T00007715001.1
MPKLQGVLKKAAKKNAQEKSSSNSQEKSVKKREQRGASTGKSNSNKRIKPATKIAIARKEIAQPKAKVAKNPRLPANKATKAAATASLKKKASKRTTTSGSSPSLKTKKSKMASSKDEARPASSSTAAGDRRAQADPPSSSSANAGTKQPLLGAKMIPETASAKRILLLTGSPGVGKSTMLQNVGAALSTKGFQVFGFYSAEMRDGSGGRNGFEMISLTNRRKKCCLADVGSGTATAPFETGNSAAAAASASTTSDRKMFPRVGKYRVHLQEFEDFAMECFEEFWNTKVVRSGKNKGTKSISSGEKAIFLLDEIGKMESFSDKFNEQVQKLLSADNVLLLATVSQKGTGIMEQTRSCPGAHLHVLSREKRELTAPVCQSAIVEHFVNLVGGGGGDNYSSFAALGMDVDEEQAKKEPAAAAGRTKRWGKKAT